MSEEYKYNLLTQELLLQGYTTENHPDYVRIGIGKMGKSPLENSDGGFVYTDEYLEEKTFMSGCGLYVKWENCIDRLEYMNETVSNCFCICFMEKNKNLFVSYSLLSLFSTTRRILS